MVVFGQISFCALIVVHSLFSLFWSINLFTFGSYEKINCLVFVAAENTKIILNCLDLLSILYCLCCDVVLCCQF